MTGAQGSADTTRELLAATMERIARAMHEVPGQPGVYGRIPWERLIDQHRDAYRQMAQAAIDALLPVVEAAKREAAVLGDNLVWLSKWVDRGNAHRNPEAVLWSRVLKVAEEVGEVYAALSGAVGENPRKGVTHTFADVEDELLDVASAALCAVEHLRGHDVEALRLLSARVGRTVTRARAAALRSTADQPPTTHQEKA